MLPLWCFSSFPVRFAQCAWGPPPPRADNPCALRRDLAVAGRPSAPRPAEAGTPKRSRSAASRLARAAALPRVLSLFSQARKVFQHLSTVRDRAAGQPRCSGLERQLSLRPRVTPGAGALDARLETLEANGLLRADVIVMVGRHRVVSCASIKSSRWRAAICARRRRTSSARYLAGPLERSPFRTWLGRVSRSLDWPPATAGPPPLAGPSEKSSDLAREPSTRVMRALLFECSPACFDQRQPNRYRTRTV